MKKPLVGCAIAATLALTGAISVASAPDAVADCRFTASTDENVMARGYYSCGIVYVSITRQGWAQLYTKSGQGDRVDTWVYNYSGQNFYSWDAHK